MTANTDLPFATISKDVFMAVEPMRIAVYALALSVPVDDAKEVSQTIKDRVAVSIERICKAHDMLTVGFPDLLKKGRYALPSELEAKYISTQRMVANIQKQIKTDDAVDYPLDKTLRFDDATMEELEAAITDFLTELETHALEADGHSRRSDHTAIKGAVEEIRKISMSINLISINASIEAARAGDAGRGFGVIANEIQTLSLRSQTSLEQIVKSVGT